MTTVRGFPLTAVPDYASDLITLPQAANRLGISARTAQRLAAAGEFPGGAAIRVGRKWVISVPKLERALHGEAS